MSSQGTDLLCVVDAYRRSAQGMVLEADTDERGPYVILDKSLFYPQGGGQKGDRGMLRLDLGDVAVVDTRKIDAEIRSYLPRETHNTQLSLMEGSDVHQEIDWEFRYHQMKMHSTAHFLHGALEELVGHELPYPVRSPLDETGGECHYDFVGEFDARELAEATANMNEYMAEGYTITTTAEESRGPGFRSWHCNGRSILCGGLHPANSREIGLIETSMRQRRGKSLVHFWPKS
jgi:alanyl-tRNA synthetase